MYVTSFYEGLFTPKQGVRILNPQKNPLIFSDFSDFLNFFGFFVNFSGFFLGVLVF